MYRNNNDSYAEYVCSFQKGEEKGFSFLFREYYPALCYFSSQFVKEKSIAEEIAGDALMKLWQRRENFDKMATINSFLYTTARNASLNWIRQQRKVSRMLKEMDYLTQGSELNKFQKIIETETYREIFIALDSLPPKCREIFKMLFIEGKGYDQIALELNLSTKTIYSQKDRALSLIRQRLSLS